MRDFLGSKRGVLRGSGSKAPCPSAPQAWTAFCVWSGRSSGAWRAFWARQVYSGWGSSRTSATGNLDCCQGILFKLPYFGYIVSNMVCG